VTWVMAGECSRIGLWIPQVGFAGGQPGAHVHFAMHIPEKDYDVLAEQLRSHGCAFTESMFFPTAGGPRRLRSDADGHCIEFWRWDVAGHLDESAERAGRPDDSSVRWLVAITSISGRTSDQNVAAIRRARM
jgi:hypothetical protein